MKWRAFILRVGICWAISMIPIPDLENQIQEARVQWANLDASSLRVCPLWATHFISLGLVLATGAYILSSTILLAAIVIPTLGAVFLLLGYHLLLTWTGVYIPLTHGVVALLAAYLVFTGYLQAVQENRQWRSLKEAQYLRELDQMKTNFLSLVSHDLKTPIAKIQAVVERLRRDSGLNQEQRLELLESIDASNQELKHYITSILNLSRIESQKVILNKKSNDINLTVREVLRRLRPIAGAKQIQFEEDLEPLFSVEYDDELIRQVLGNLVDNAVKYSQPGSKVSIRTREETGFIRVDVQDSGQGIPAAQLPYMFTKFYRFRRPLNEKVKGTGLGLYLAKYFIELHGGTIRLKSVEGQGTVFTFTLPLQDAEAETLLG